MGRYREEGHKEEDDGDQILSAQKEEGKTINKRYELRRVDLFASTSFLCFYAS